MFFTLHEYVDFFRDEVVSNTDSQAIFSASHTLKVVVEKEEHTYDALSI